MPTQPSALTFGGVRYIPQGTREYYWVPTIAVLTAPTRAELIAGTRLTGSVGGISGWGQNVNFVKVPDFGSRNVGVIPGTIELDSSTSFTFYQSSTSVDARSLFTVGLVGFVTIMLEGDVAGQKMDVFKLQVANVTPSQDLGDTPATLNIGVALSSYTPYVTIPA